jgi:hypothetical protein
MLVITMEVLEGTLSPEQILFFQKKMETVTFD